MSKKQSVLIAFFSSAACLILTGAARLWGREPVQGKAVLFNLFSVIDIIAAVVAGVIVVYSINRAKRKMRK